MNLEAEIKQMKREGLSESEIHDVIAGMLADWLED